MNNGSSSNHDDKVTFKWTVLIMQLEFDPNTKAQSKLQAG